MTEHKHTNWTGRKCQPCGGSGEVGLDPECASTCAQPWQCRCPHPCGACAGTGDEHGEVPAKRCSDGASCPSRCPDCYGTGERDVERGGTWVECQRCNGTGGLT